MSRFERHNPPGNLDGNFPQRELVEDALQDSGDAVSVEGQAVERSDRNFILLLHPGSQLPGSGGIGLDTVEHHREGLADLLQLVDDPLLSGGILLARNVGDGAVGGDDQTNG